MKLSDIRLGKNIRDIGDVSALAESIKAHGQLEPLIVRKTKAGVELVCGYRRYHALKKAGVPEAEVVTREIPDDMVSVVQATENVHRKDMAFMELARYVAHIIGPATQKSQLLNGEYSTRVKTLAQALALPLKEIHRMVRVTELPKEVLSLADKGELLEGHLRELLDLTNEQVLQCLKDCIRVNLGFKGKMDSTFQVQRIRDWKRNRGKRELDAAPFPLDKEYAGLPPCSKCRCNTGADGLLFDNDEVETKASICRDTNCYRKKENQSHRDLRAQFEKSVPVLKDAEYLGIVKPSEWEKRAPKEVRGYPVVDKKKALTQKNLAWVIFLGKAPQVLYLQVTKTGTASTKNPEAADHGEAILINGVGRDIIREVEESFLVGFKPTEKQMWSAVNHACGFVGQKITKENFLKLLTDYAINNEESYLVEVMGFDAKETVVTWLKKQYPKFKARMAEVKGYELPEDIKQAVLKEWVKDNPRK